MPAISDTAICLRQWDYSETSQTAALFCRESGLVRGLAKGSRRDKAPFSGGLEPVTRGAVGVILKPGAQLATITEWDLTEPYFRVRRTLSAFYAGTYLVDIVRHAVTDADPHPALFDALDGALGRLGDDDGADQRAVLDLQWALLDETGYRPELGRDVAGGEIETAPTYGFHPALGGLTRDPGAETQQRVWRVRRETVELLRSLPERAEAGDAAVKRANHLLAAYLRELLGREPPSMRAFFGPFSAG